MPEVLQAVAVATTGTGELGFMNEVSLAAVRQRFRTV